MLVKYLPQDDSRKKWLVIGVTATLAWGMTYLSVEYFSDYGLAMFCFIPFFIGAFSSLLNAVGTKRTWQESRNMGLSALGIYALGLLVFAIEGIICLVMAAPFGLALTFLGMGLGHEIQKRHLNSTPILIGLSLLAPSLMSFENRFPITPSVFTVTTSVEINAAPDKIWDKLVAFSEITEPRDWLFKTGIAYPIRAEIKGDTGVGSIRYCHFSTGSFVEPITVWDRPNLLKFSVLEQPAPMIEMSPYELDPKHLHGYFVSQQGQFRLISLPNGGTRLEGTTWYYHRIRPEIYWRLWSDYILHKIHERVLNHIKNDVESL
jgi:hypothetical protein